MAQLVDRYHISMKNAWSMTLREYTCLAKHSKVKPVTSTYDKRDLDDILASFEVKGL